MYNYNILLNMKYRKWYILVILLLFLIVIIIISSFITIYSTYNNYAISDGKYLLIDVPINNSDAIKKGIHLKIDNKKYNYKISNISSIYNSGIINYQTYQIEIEHAFQKNMVLNTTFYYHPEKVIKKLIKIIF